MKVFVLLWFVIVCHQLTSAYPDCSKETVKDTFYGVEVSEDYRWLEDLNDPQVREWTDSQNRYTHDYLARLKGIEPIREQVTAILSDASVSYYGIHYQAGRFFALKDQPPQQQPYLITFSDLDDLGNATILVDPNTINPNGTTAIDWYHSSPDGKLIAVSLSVGGSESGDVYVFDTETGEQVYEVISRVNTGTAGGDLAWTPDSSGFFYTRHPLPGEREEKDINFYQQAYFHQLGTAMSEDRYEIGKDFPRIAEIEFEMHQSGQLLLTVQDGDGGQFAHYLMSPEGKWRVLSSFEDKVIQATFADKDTLMVLSREQAPKGKILKVETRTLSIVDAKLIIPEGKDTIVNSFYHSPPSILATDHLLFIRYQLGGPSEIRVFDHAGNQKLAPTQESVATVDGICPIEDDDILFYSDSYTAPRRYYLYHAEKHETIHTAISSTSKVDFSDIKVVREFATSIDGTKIPVNILIPSAAEGKISPCIVYGYGGYGVNITPRFRASLRVLFDRGFIYAVANIRGGGEFGEQWHQQGMLTRKQNVFDDFSAVCEYMIEQKYTDSDQLAIMGGSNGGLLMGATLTQHPNLARAVVSYVGIYDMLRSELSPNGSFNIPEFGTVKDSEQFFALYAYSPYHNVANGTEYPSTLFLTGENDPRVDPMQSRKMTARLQEANASGNPILLRSSADAGHGSDTPLSERIEETTTVYSFLLNELGVSL